MRDFGIGSVTPNEFNSESLLEMREFQNVKGQKIIIFRGEGGRPLLGEALEARGAEVMHAILYRRVMPEACSPALLAAWKQCGIDVIVVTSCEGLENLMNMTGVQGKIWLMQKTLLVSSLALEVCAKEKGFHSKHKH